MQRTRVPVTHDAVLLAGGRASRLGGVDKTALGSDGRTLFRRALDAAAGAETVVVVGLRDGHEPPSDALLTREDPPFSGPAAAIGAGLDTVTAGAPWTLVLACDLVRPEEAVGHLHAAVRAAGDTSVADGFVALDDDGHRQPLLALYRTSALLGAVRAARETEHGLTDLSLRRLLAPLTLVEVPVSSALSEDVDTPDDADRLTGTRSGGRGGSALLD